MRPRTYWTGSLALVLLGAACATVPITGRSQLNLISDQQLAVASHQEFSRFMQLVSQKNALLSPTESPQAKAAVETVNRVSDRVIDAAGLRGQRNWEVVVVKSRKANAFVTPNGKIVVFTGILPVAKSEAGLAAVIGHEVSHVVARHQAERVSQVLLAQMAVSAVDAALASSNSKYRPVVGAALGLGAQYGVLLPFSREHESEADHIGLLYMAKAGYDPAEAISFWERMDAAGGSGPWEFLSTHPSHATRRQQIRAWLPEAMLYYADRSRPLPSNLAELGAMQAEHASQMALAPIAARPSPLGQGFWYSFKASNRANATAYRVDRTEACASGECYVVVADTGATATHRSDYALMEVRNPDGSWVRFTPALRTVQWPLRVGDTWSEPITIERSTGQRQNARVKGDVVSYESVSVPAGSFMAFKIVITLDGRRFREGWYAPETRTFVRGVVYDSRGNPTVSELVDYQKSDEPAGSLNPT